MTSGPEYFQKTLFLAATHRHYIPDHMYCKSRLLIHYSPSWNSPFVPILSLCTQRHHQLHEKFSLMQYTIPITSMSRTDIADNIEAVLTISPIIGATSTNGNTLFVQQQDHKLLTNLLTWSVGISQGSVSRCGEWSNNERKIFTYMLICHIYSG